MEKRYTIQDVREALDFGVRYGFTSPNFEPETCDEAWMDYVEFMKKEETFLDTGE